RGDVAESSAVGACYRRRVAGSLSLDPTLTHDPAGRSRVASSRKVSRYSGEVKRNVATKSFFRHAPSLVPPHGMLFGIFDHSANCKRLGRNGRTARSCVSHDTLKWQRS